MTDGITTPDKEWIERATAWFDDRKINHTPADVLALARELQSAHDLGVSRERERVAARIQIAVNTVLVDVSETALGAPLVLMAEHPDVSGHDAAQLGWFACWRTFSRHLDGLVAALTPTPSDGERG